MDMTLSELRPNAVRISLRGRLDTAGVDAIEKEFAVASQARHALVDLSGVSFVASMGIRMFFSSARTLKAAGCRLILVAPQGLVYEVLDNAGVTQILPVVPDEKQALELLPAVEQPKAALPSTGGADGSTAPAVVPVAMTEAPRSASTTLSAVVDEVVPTNLKMPSQPGAAMPRSRAAESDETDAGITSAVSPAPETIVPPPKASAPPTPTEAPRGSPRLMWIGVAAGIIGLVLVALFASGFFRSTAPGAGITPEGQPVSSAAPRTSAPASPTTAQAAGSISLIV